ncbi:MAG: MarR family transcriptional regulator [Nitriliruptoraceae bacterium]|nr:MarR family transcriptional regulator [Nitriliruptoraceae bacterium]
MSGSTEQDDPFAHLPAALRDLPPRHARILELLRRFGDAVEHLEHEWSRVAGLHRSDLAALNHLARDPEPLGMRELRDRLALSPGAMTALVDRLEARGHVQRTDDPTDRRRVAVTLSDDARALGGQFFGEMAGRVLAELQAFDDEELAAIERFLAVLSPAVAPDLDT